jgi:hypothetical protein
MTFAVLADNAWAMLSGGAGRILTRARLRCLTRVSGGVWLAFSRARQLFGRGTLSSDAAADLL